MDIQKKIISAASNLSGEIEADAILILTETGKSYKYLKSKSNTDIIALTPIEDTYEELRKDPDIKVIHLTVRDPSRTGQIRHAVWRGLNNGLLRPGDIIVCLTGGIRSPQGTDTISVYFISEAESTLAGVIESDPVMNAVVQVCCDLGSVGRKGEPVGTAFMIGDFDGVMEESDQLGLNPFKGYDNLSITDSENWELIKRYAFLDGAFILDRDGTIKAAGRYLESDEEVDITSGLGTRHIAVASMTAATEARGVTVSGTDGVIRIFSKGRILGEIDPRSKMLKEISI